MPQRPEPLEVGGSPDLLKLAEEVQRTGAPRLLQRDGEDIAVISPAKRARSRRAGAMRLDDPFLTLVGVGHSVIPGAVSENKHEYLAKAYEHQ